MKCKYSSEVEAKLNSGTINVLSSFPALIMFMIVLAVKHWKLPVMIPHSPNIFTFSRYETEKRNQRMFGVSLLFSCALKVHLSGFIATFLNQTSTCVCSCSSVSRRLNELSKHNPLWRTLCSKHWLLTEWVLYTVLFFKARRLMKYFPFSLRGEDLYQFVCSVQSRSQEDLSLA